MVYKSGQIFLPFCHNSRVWQTDGRTDGRTDRRTDRILIARPRLHYMQRGKNCVIREQQPARCVQYSQVQRSRSCIPACGTKIHFHVKSHWNLDSSFQVRQLSYQKIRRHPNYRSQRLRSNVAKNQSISRFINQSINQAIAIFNVAQIVKLLRSPPYNTYTLNYVIFWSITFYFMRMRSHRHTHTPADSVKNKNNCVDSKCVADRQVMSFLSRKTFRI